MESIGDIFIFFLTGEGIVTIKLFLFIQGPIITCYSCSLGPNLSLGICFLLEDAFKLSPEV